MPLGGYRCVSVYLCMSNAVIQYSTMSPKFLERVVTGTLRCLAFFSKTAISLPRNFGAKVVENFRCIGRSLYRCVDPCHGRLASPTDDSDPFI